MSTTNSLLSVAETYARMLNPAAAKVERPHWVPSTIAEEHVNAFVKAICEARSNKKNIVEFSGKKYVIKEEDPEQQAQELQNVTKDLPVAGDDSKEIKHANVAAAQEKGDTIENKPEEVKEEEEAEIQAANVSDKRAEADPQDTLPMMAENDESDDDDDDDESESDEDEIDHEGDEDEDDWKNYDGDNDEDDQIAAEQANTV